MHEFFIAMIPPTITQQEHKVAVVHGKPMFYEPQELKTVRQKLLAAVAPHVPREMYTGPVQLTTKWIWPIQNRQADPSDWPSDWEWKTTRPDTDNLIKMLKDCMTKAGFWKDDALVCSEITEKFFGSIPGIYVGIKEL